MKFFNIRFFRRSWTKISFGYNQIYRKKKLGISMTWTRFHTLGQRGHNKKIGTFHIQSGRKHRFVSSLGGHHRKNVYEAQGHRLVAYWNLATVFISEGGATRGSWCPTKKSAPSQNPEKNFRFARSRIYIQSRLYGRPKAFLKTATNGQLLKILHYDLIY